MSEGRRLTRRDVLSGAAVAGAGALLGPAAARAAGPRDAGDRDAGDAVDAGGRVFRRRVGRLGAGISAPIAVGRSFCLVALRWSTPADAHLELRTRLPDGRWGRWGAASSAGHEGDGTPVGSARVGEPMWTGPARELQLRSRGAVEDVWLELVAAEPARSGVGDGPLVGAGAAVSLPLAVPELPAGPGQPPIIARRAWAGGGHAPVKGPFYGSIELGIVHHTENPNGYSRGEVPAMLRAIYEFHVYGRGWWDIGYNFVVDHFGRIWEARQGGIDLPVSGAQAGDWNQISFGVSMLGTYTDVTPSPAALAAVEHLLAWKMALGGVPVRGSVAEVVGAEGVAWTQFRAGQHVRFPRIAGHRDVDATDCPGDALYRHLPLMRPRIARLAGTPPVLQLGAEIAGFAGRGALLALSGRLARPDGPALAGAPIVIETVVGRFGETRRLAETTTDADGRFTVSLTPRESLLLRARHAAEPAAVSELIAVQGAGGAPPVAFGLSRPTSASSTAPAGAARTQT